MQAIKNIIVELTIVCGNGLFHFEIKGEGNLEFDWNFAILFLTVSYCDDSVKLEFDLTRTIPIEISLSIISYYLRQFSKSKHRALSIKGEEKCRIWRGFELFGWTVRLSAAIVCLPSRKVEARDVGTRRS